MVQGALGHLLHRDIQKELSVGWLSHPLSHSLVKRPSLGFLPILREDWLGQKKQALVGQVPDPCIPDLPFVFYEV